MNNIAHLPLLAAGLLCLGRTFTEAAETPPSSKIEILQPVDGQTLHGTVRVRVRITPPQGRSMPGQAYAGFGGPPWAKLSPAAGLGEWVGSLDSTLVPNGEHEFRVVTDERRAKLAIAVGVQNPLKCYFGDLHSHTMYSDGAAIPAVAHEFARNEAQLDFFSLTDHLEQVDDAEWEDMRERSWKANEDGVFVTLPGLEWTKREGHACIFDPRTRHWPKDVEGFYRAAAEAGVVVKFNHPGEGTNVFNGLAYSEAGDQAVQLMEVRRAPEELAYRRALRLGWHLAPDGADDTHEANWGKNWSWTGIWAPGLSRRNVWAALKGRHCFSTLDRDCQLYLAVNGAVMGDIVPEPSQAVGIMVRVKDADPQDRVERIELFEDGEIVESREVNASETEWRTGRLPRPGPHYYFVKVTQADGNLMWSAPVWVTIE